MKENESKWSKAHVWSIIVAISVIIGIIASIITIYEFPSFLRSNSNVVPGKVNLTSSPANASPPPITNTPLSCISVGLCTSYEMTIWITSIVSNKDHTSLWNFQLANGNGDLDVVLWVTIGEIKTYYGKLHLSPNDILPISVPEGFVPNNGSLVEITFTFGSSSNPLLEVNYSQACTYVVSSQNTCQA